MKRPLVYVPFSHNLALDFSGSSEFLQTSGGVTIGIANAWTIAFWIKGNTFATSDVFLSFGTAGTNSRITIQVSLASASNMRVITADSAGATLKDYTFPGFFTNAVWKHCVVTWNGTSLLAYTNAVQTAQSTTTTDNAGSMADDSRTVTIGANQAGAAGINVKSHSVYIWNTTLAQADVTSLYNGGGGSFVNPYMVQPASLKHAFLLGHGNGLALDYQAASPLDLLANATGITAADVIYDSPV